MDTFHFTIAGLVLVGVVLLAPVFACNRRADVERNLNPLWQKRCSGYIGLLGTMIMRVALYQDFLVIGFLGQTVILYSDVAELKAKRGFWSVRGSGVALKRLGLSSSYHFNLNSRDATEFMRIVEARVIAQSLGGAS